MAVMVIIFIILFSVSVAALSITSSQRKALLKKSWRSLSDKSKGEVQNWGNCCGFEYMNITKGPEGHPSCAEVLILLNFGLQVVRVVVKCTCNLFTHEAPKSFRNSLTGVCAFQVELEIRNVGFCGGRKTGQPGEKPSNREREPTTTSTHI